jgi:hypothetical protein
MSWKGLTLPPLIFRPETPRQNKRDPVEVISARVDRLITLTSRSKENNIRKRKC